LAWRYDPTNFEMILSPETGLPAERNQGEASIILDIQTDPSLNPENTVILSGDGTGDDPSDGWQADAPNGITVMNTVETVNSLMISGEISYAEYVDLIPELTSQVPRTELLNENGIPIYFLPGATYIIGGVEVQFRPNGVIVDGEFRSMNEKFSINGGEVQFPSCFGPEVPIDMWPLDPDLKPGPDGIYDQDAVCAKVWKKPIELIEVGDIVVSFDGNGNLVPGAVTRTFQNDAKILLDFHGTRVTPGHVYYRSDSKRSYKYETLIDVLRDDGIVKREDGTLIRAATNVAVGSTRDGFVQAIARKRNSDGTFEQSDEGRIRLGTRFLVGEGKARNSFAVADLIEHGDGVVGDDELIRVGEGRTMPFLWEFGETLPKPEDFVLACSGTTLRDIYKATEWESQSPRLPAPLILDRGAVQPLNDIDRLNMPRNEPLNVAHNQTLASFRKRGDWKQN
jgi:hypothetical protein